MSLLRFQFSLRTLFVALTLVFLLLAGGGWIIAQFRWIDARHEMLGRATHLDRPTQAPALLWIFGEQGWGEISVELAPGGITTHEQESDRLLQLFPEAKTVSAYGKRNQW